MSKHVRLFHVRLGLAALALAALAGVVVVAVRGDSLDGAPGFTIAFDLIRR